MAGLPGGVRAALTPVALGVARARSAPSRWALPALGVALATALLGSAAGGGTVAGEQAARDAIHDLAPAARSIRLTWSGGLPDGTEARARTLLGDLTPAAQTRSLLLLPSVGMTADGTRHELQLAAVAPLRRWVRLRSGRLPRQCTPTRCEVLAAGGGSAPRTLERNGTTLVTVGTGTLTSTVPLGFVPSVPISGQMREQRPKPLLLGASPTQVDATVGFQTVFRTQGWTAPLEVGSRPSWQLGGVARKLSDARTELSRATDEFAITAPEQPLALAQARAQEARSRVTLVGAGAAALFAAFVILAGTAMLRDLEGERQRLERRGGRRWHLALLSLTEAAWPAMVGVAAGAGVAVLVTALRARAADIPVGAALDHTFLTGSVLGIGAALLLTACTLLVLAARPWGDSASRVADVVALGCAGMLIVAFARGGESGSPGDPLPALLPPLVCLVAAVLVARLALPALRGLEVAGRRAPLPLRLASLGLSRAPTGPALTIAVVAVGCGLSCFAFAYRATLRHGDADQAAYAVPLDVTIQEGPNFISPLTLAPAARWRGLAGGGDVLPVQRASASVPRGAAAVELPLLTLPADGLRDIRRWRSGDASASRTELARRLRLAGPLAPNGPVVGPGDTTLTVGSARAVGDVVDLTALLQLPDGTLQPVPLGRVTARARALRVRLPSSAQPRRLIGVDVDLQLGLVATNRHQEAERGAIPSINAGTLTLRGLAVGRRPIDLSAWRGRGPLRQVEPVAGGVAVPYVFDRRGRALLSPAQPGEGKLLPVLVDRATAAAAGPRGLLPVTFEGERVRARVVGTVDRFPTVDANADGFVVADRASLSAVLQASAPGLAHPDELWIATSPAGERRLAAAVRSGPLSSLGFASRRAGERALQADPLARELVRTLVGAALVALVLAALGVLVAVALALRDDAAELFDLEALGVPPRLLRQDIRIRALTLGGLGLACGVVLGLALVTLAVDAVQVTAAGVRAVPPLVAVAPWAAWGLVAMAFVACVAVGVSLLTRRALSGATP